MRRVLMVLLLALLVLAGCGGGHHYKGPQRATTLGTVAGHPCAPNDFYQQCALRGQPPHVGLKAGASIFARGVDFAWGGPSCASAKANGWIFGASYLSYDGSKNWSHAQFDDYMRNGCKAVFVWESGSGDATGGYGLGQSQARTALAQYRSYVPNGRVVIYFAIDCDCSGGQVDGYFRGVLSVLSVSQVGAYGGINPLNYLFNTHLIAWGWQTYAWSGGAWNGSQLEQWLNDGSVDYDRAIAADYGQVPAPGPPPPPPDPYLVFPHGPFRDGNRLIDEHATVVNWDKDGCQSPVRRHQCVVGRDHLIFLRGRISYLAHHVWGTPRRPNWSPNNGGVRWREENRRINATHPTHP